MLIRINCYDDNAEECNHGKSGRQVVASAHNNLVGKMKRWQMQLKHEESGGQQEVLLVANPECR